MPDQSTPALLADVRSALEALTKCDTCEGEKQIKMECGYCLSGGEMRCECDKEPFFDCPQCDGVGYCYPGVRDPALSALAELERRIAELERDRERVSYAVAFEYPITEVRHARYVQEMPIRVEARDQRDGTRLWAVKQLGNCLRKDGEWELEMQPSSRTDEFIASTRWGSLDDVMEVARAAIDAARGKGKRNG